MLKEYQECTGVRSLGNFCVFGGILGSNLGKSSNIFQVHRESLHFMVSLWTDKELVPEEQIQI